MSPDSPTSVSPAQAEIPSNIYRPTNPFKARLVENIRLTSPDSPNDVRHLVINFEGSDYRYVEGQSAGILPPGTDETGKAHKLRLYSIASAAVGDDGSSKTLTLCVKRVLWKDETTGKEVFGVCSNHLCDLKPGDTVDLTGPTGKGFLMPEDPNANIITIATGTGIAPFRGFVRKRFDGKSQSKGQTWVVLGVPYSSDLLYHDELQGYQSQPGYQYITAISREQQTADGRKMYVQDRLYERRAELLALLEQPNTYLYICGLRGMEKGILAALEQACTESGKNWEALYQQLHAEKRWRVEVY